MQAKKARYWRRQERTPSRSLRGQAAEDFFQEEGKQLRLRSAVPRFRGSAAEDVAKILHKKSGDGDNRDRSPIPRRGSASAFAARRGGSASAGASDRRGSASASEAARGSSATTAGDRRGSASAAAGRGGSASAHGRWGETTQGTQRSTSMPSLKERGPGARRSLQQRCAFVLSENASHQHRGFQQTWCTNQEPSKPYGFNPAHISDDMLDPLWWADVSRELFYIRTVARTELSS